ncbi:hypothetical protein [Nisaea sediminum]|uniref:hypothetical protein n=1 Tax=Nisaea sediminum TaxID=2775867 RepID=UPI001867C61D|nr:hypothetical protein [Nisaea sediminum]
MSIEDYAYFIAKGRSLEAARAAFGILEAFYAKANALRDRIGASGYCTKHHRLYAFSFDGPAPEGYRKVWSDGGKAYYAPLRKTDWGRKLVREMRAASKGEFFNLIGQTVPHEARAVIRPEGNGFLMLQVGAQRLCDEIIIFVPLNATGEPGGAPADAEPIALSRYYEMQHDHQLAAQARIRDEAEGTAAAGAA